MPTGIEHGTITVVAGGKPYEVTTLRADVETDGRRAKVSFGRDWKLDAERRDFTINALYAEADGDGRRPGRRPRRHRRRADCASSAIRNSASARIICASCASSASSPGTAQAGRMPTG